MREIRIVESSPEKAGVGGSIPSLATCFQSLTGTPKPCFIPFHSNNVVRDSLCGVTCGSGAGLCCFRFRLIFTFFPQVRHKTEKAPRTIGAQDWFASSDGSRPR